MTGIWLASQNQRKAEPLPGLRPADAGQAGWARCTPRTTPAAGQPKGSDMNYMLIMKTGRSALLTIGLVAIEWR